MSTLKTNKIVASTGAEITISPERSDNGTGNIHLAESAANAKPEHLYIHGGPFGQNGKTGIGIKSASMEPRHPLDIYEMGGLILSTVILQGLGSAEDTEVALKDTYGSGNDTSQPSSDWYIDFYVPQSQKVEIQISAYLATTAPDNNGSHFIHMALSKAPGWSSLGTIYEREVAEPDEDDNMLVRHSWYLDCDALADGAHQSDNGTTDFRPGGYVKLYIHTRTTDAGHAWWQWGGTNTGKKGPVIIKAISLPKGTASISSPGSNTFKAFRTDEA